jgi:CARDB/MBG domain (YGX type)
MRQVCCTSSQTRSSSGRPAYPLFGIVSKVIDGFVGVGNVKTLLMTLLFIMLVLWPAGQAIGQTITPSPNPLNAGNVRLGSTFPSTLILYNSTPQPIILTGIQVQGHQSQAGFLTTIGGVAPGGQPGTDPTTLTPGQTMPITNVQFSDLESVMTGSNGMYFLADTGHNVILLYDSRSGVVSRFAGTGSVGSSGDGGTALSATLNGPRALTRDHSVNLYIADTGSFRVRKVQWLGTSYPVGNISPFAGNGSPCTDPADGCGDGQLATSARLGTVLGITHLTNDDLLISDMDACRVRRVSSADQNIYPFAGDGKCESTGDGGLAINAGLNHPEGIYGDQLGNIFIADTGSNLVRKIDAITGIITTYAGNGSTFYDNDFLPATSVGVPAPRALYVDYLGNLFIACGDSTIRKVDVNGIISTVAGVSPLTPGAFVSGYNGDTLAALTQLSTPQGVATDFAGNLLIGDSGNNLLRWVDFTTLNSAAEFTETDTCADPIPPLGSCSVSVSFAPVVPNVRLAQLVVTQAGQNSPLVISMSGIGLFTYARIAPYTTSSTGLTVETPAGQKSASQTVLFANSGNVPLQMTSVGLTGTSPGDFDETDNCTAGMINAYAYCTVAVTFDAPLNPVGPSSAALEFVSDAQNGTQDVQFTGTSVVQQTTNITWTAPAAIVYGTALNAKQLNATASGPGTFTYTPAATSVLPAGTQVLTVVFTPADPLQYTPATASVPLLVNSAPLTVTVNNLSILTTGTPSFTSTFTGLVSPDSLTVTYSTNPALPSAPPYSPGVYTITATANGGPWSNYTPTFKTGTLTIGASAGIDLAENINSVSAVFNGTGVQLAVNDSVVNIGSSIAGSTTTNYYIWPTSQGTTMRKWMLLGNRIVASLAPGPGNTASTTLSIAGTLSGSYYFMACANAYQTVTETNYANNCVPYGPSVTAPTAINILPDLEVVPGSLSFTVVAPGQIKVIDTTENLGPAPATAWTSTAYYLSTVDTTGKVLNAKWMYLGNRNVPMLAAQATSTPTPATAPTLMLPSYLHTNYAITACANAYATVAEVTTQNNCQSVPITLP